MKLIFPFLTIAVLAVSCQENKPNLSNQKEKEELLSKIDIVPEEIKIEFAENFHVNSIKGGYELELLDPATTCVPQEEGWCKGGNRNVEGWGGDSFISK